MNRHEILKEIRLKSGMTQAEISSIVGCKQNTWSQYENGKAFPSIKILNRIVKVAKQKRIKIKFEYLFFGDENNE